MSPFRAWASFAGLCALLLAGCNPSTGTVTGTVYLDGKPLDRGSVMFHPTGAGTKSYGEILEGGEYEIHTGTKPGIPPGEYVVTVVATEEMDPVKAGKERDYLPKSLTPPRYGDVKKSDLKATVQPGSNSLDFKLTTK